MTRARFVGVSMAALAVLCGHAEAQPDVTSDATLAATPAPPPAAPSAPLVDPPGRDEFAAPPRPKLRLELELFAHGVATVANDVTAPEFGVTRAESGLEIAPRAGVFAELRLETIRSATAQSGFGIDGDSLVLRVKRARLVGEHQFGAVTLFGEGGLVMDPWVGSLDATGQLRALSPSATERELGWQSSDLGAVAGVRWRLLRATLAIVNGEGRNFPERNTGKTTIAVVENQASFRVAGQPLRLWVGATLRDGSVSAGRVRDRRIGTAMSITTPWLSVGGEALRGWGLALRGDVNVDVGAGWLYVPIAVGRRAVLLAGRASLTHVVANDAAGKSISTLAAVGYEHLRLDVAASPWLSQANARLWLSVERQTVTGIAEQLTNLGAQDATVAMATLSVTLPQSFGGAP